MFKFAIKNKINVSSIFLLIIVLFFGVDNVYAAESLECPHCSGENFILYRTNSTKGLVENIYYCKDCKSFFSNISYGDEIESIINDNDEHDVDDEIVIQEESDNVDSGEITVINIKSTSTSDDEDETTVGKNVVYPEEPEEDEKREKKAATEEFIEIDKHQDEKETYTFSFSDVYETGSIATHSIINENQSEEIATPFVLDKISTRSDFLQENTIDKFDQYNRHKKNVLSYGIVIILSGIMMFGISFAVERNKLKKLIKKIKKIYKKVKKKKSA